MEKWRSIDGFDGRYEISDWGRVRSVRNGQILRPYIRGKYQCVSLRRPGFRKIVAVHIVVLETFRSGRPEGMVAAHLDGSIANNALSNLAWVTPQENEAHKLHHGTHNRGTNSPQARFTNMQVEVVREAHALGLSAEKLSLLTGVNPNTIYQIVRGESYSTVVSALSRFDPA